MSGLILQRLLGSNERNHTMKYSVLFALFMSYLGVIALTPVQAQDDLIYVAVEPCRIVDTRNAGGDIAANSFRNFRVSGTLGELAVQGGKSDCLDPKAGTGQKPLAIVAYVIAVPPGPGSGSGVLSAYPSNQLPPPVGSGSTVNFAAQQIIGNTTTITICDPAGSCPTDGEFAVLARNTNQHVVIDVQGYFYPVLDLIDTSKHYVIVDANDQTIGAAIGGDVGEPVIITSQGYHAEVDANDGKVHVDINVFYTDVNCTGTAYMDYLGSLEGKVTWTGLDLIQVESAVGAIFNADDTGIEYWYVPYTSTLVADIPVQSVWLYDYRAETMVCEVVVSATITTAAEVFQNDQAITGFPNAAFQAPLRYDYR